MTSGHARWSFSLRLFLLFLAFGGSTHLSNTTIEIWVLPFLGRIAAFLPHLCEMVRAIFCHISPTTFLSDSTVVFRASLVFERRSPFFPDAPIVVLTILITNRTS